MLIETTQESDWRTGKSSPLHPHLPLPGDLAPLSSALHALVTSPALAKRLRLLDSVNTTSSIRLSCFLPPRQPIFI
jgi:hypothetical protein